MTQYASGRSRIIINLSSTRYLESVDLIDQLLARKTPMTPAEVAAWLGVDVYTVRKWIRRGDLKGRKLPGGHIRVDPSDLAVFWKYRPNVAA
jgi:excisionase family DNA binding protein